MAVEILLVDDDPSVLQALRRLLYADGYRILLASGGTQALELLAGHDVAVVVCDYRMTDMNGAAVLKQAAGLRPDAVRIMLTAYGDLSTAQQAINEGQVTRFLLKPWDDAHLRAVVSDAVGQFQATRQIRRLHQLAIRQRDELRLWNRRLEKLVRQRTVELRASYEDTLNALVLALDAREHATAGHSRRVALYCLYLALELGYPRDGLASLYRGAVLHDIGKIGVPDAVLLKPGPLDAQERALMEQHVVLAARLLEPVAYLRSSVNIPRYHHERWDGKGYAAGLSGTQIPLEARIFAVIDVYDALCSQRPYKEPLPDDQARALIATEAGRHFDPQVVDAFLAVPSPVWRRLADEADTTGRFAAALRLCRCLRRPAASLTFVPALSIDR